MHTQNSNIGNCMESTILFQNNRTKNAMTELKITAGHWPFSVHICQMDNHFPKWSAAMANHILAPMVMPLFP